MEENPSVGIVIPTYNGEHLLPSALGAINAFTRKVPVLVIDSASRDNTVSVARSLGAEVHVIPQPQFNHGATRDLGRAMLNTDIVVMMTQDAIPVGADMLDRLVAPLVEGKAAVSYARQIPHDGTTFFESYPRTFNYPEVSELRGLEDTKRYGAYTFYCSNSCAAWSNAALDEIGGFGNTVSLEDTIAAAKLLRRGHKIAYCADARVKHSHNFTLKEEYRRYYDVGYVRKQQKEVLMIGGGDEGRGAAFMSSMLKVLAREHPQLIPYAIMAAAAKWLGYRAGWHSAATATLPG